MKVHFLAVGALAVLLGDPAMATSPVQGRSECRIISDAPDDARALGGMSAPPELDLLGAYLAVSATQFQVTVRVKPSMSVGPTSGENWEFSMGNGERLLQFVATRGVDGWAFSAYEGADVVDPSGSGTPQASNASYRGEINGLVDLSAGTVVMRASLSFLHLQPGSVFSHFGLDSGEGVATSGSALASTPLSPAGPMLDQGTYTGIDDARRLLRWKLNRKC